MVRINFVFFLPYNSFSIPVVKYFKKLLKMFKFDNNLELLILFIPIYIGINHAFSNYIITIQVISVGLKIISGK